MAAVTFHKLRWKNFLSTGNQFIEINLDAYDSNLVVGKNGSGKSTIIDALTFALFGKSYRKINKPQLVNSINRSDCLVEVEFTIGRTEYLVRRGIKPNVFEIEKDGDPVDQNAAVGDYQKHLEKNILRMNYKSFTQIVILGSSVFVPFMQLTTGDRRIIIDDLLDISIFSSMNVAAKGRLSEQRRKIERLDNEIFVVEERLASQQRYIKGLQNKVSGIIDEKKDDIAKLKKEAKNLKDERAKLTKEVKDNQVKPAELRKFEKLQAQLEEYGKRFKTNKRKLGKEVSFYENNSECSTCKQSISDEHREEMAEAKREKIEEIERGEIELESELKKVNAKLKTIGEKNRVVTDLNQKISHIDSKLDSNAESIRRIDEEIDRLKQNDTDEIDKEREVLRELDKELVVLNDERVEEREQLFLLEEAQEVLKDSGIKTKIIRQYLPVINKLINKYLQSLNFFVNFKLDENFKETIVSQFRDNFSYRSFSEGQKVRVDLALLFTWVEIARMKNSVNTNLLFLDEIFDGSLDSEGIDDFMKLIDDAGQNKNVFVISHRADQMMDKFDNVIQFETHKNFSRKKEDE